MEISGERHRLDPVERAAWDETGECEDAELDETGECEDAELDVEEAFGEHDIEYWVRKGERLVPATAEEIAQIHEWERELMVRVRLERWRHDELRRQPWPLRLLRWALARRGDAAGQAPRRTGATSAGARVTSP